MFTQVLHITHLEMRCFRRFEGFGEGHEFTTWKHVTSCELTGHDLFRNLDLLKSLRDGVVEHQSTGYPLPYPFAVPVRRYR